MLALIGLALGGIIIGGGIISFLCDELSDEEREKQRAIQEEADLYAKEKEARIAALRLETQQKIETLKMRNVEQQNEISIEIDKEVAKLEEQLKQNEEEALLNAREALKALYLKEANEKLVRNDMLNKDIRRVIALVKEQQKEQMTVMRGNALRQFRRELDEVLEKCIAYKSYIYDYISFIKKVDSQQENKIGEFEFILPHNYPYKGKVFNLTAEQVKRCRFSIPYCYDILFEILDLDDKVFPSADPDYTIPFLCNYRLDSYTNREGISYKRKKYNLSQSKGKLKFDITANPHLGILAEIIKTDRDFIYMTYNGIDIRLHWSKLENPKRKSPIGAELRVFPTLWDNALEKTIEVSELYSDALSCYSFNELPLVVATDEVDSFMKNLDNKRLSDSDEEWRIAPYDEKDLPNVNKVKLQLGNSAVFLASVDEERAYFKYECELDYSNFSIQPEDIFAFIDCRLLCVPEDELNKIPNETYSNMGALSIWVFKEFKDQKAIKASQPGMIYFTKWEEIADKLITYKYKGDRNSSVEISIKYTEISDKGIRVYFSDPSRMNAFYARVTEESLNKRNLSFFIEITKGEYMFIRRFAPDCTYADFFGAKAKEFFDIPQQKIRIYSKQYAYIELQQKRALSQFRVGNLVNPFLQVCAINIKEMKSVTELKFDNDEVYHFYNERLNHDLSQAEAVKRALNEENIFLIQGPPGTGKTTVIIEIIKQLMIGPVRILVSSQANVAVDNVIQRLLGDFDERTMIRVGAAKKMSEKVRSISFEEQYDRYVKSIRAKEGDISINQTLLKRWLDIADPEKDGRRNPDVGELLLRSHRIIGATCVGLARKNIGLERLQFDLVIIDEAGKALPAEILIPYIRAKKVIIIGDHKQLPPTIDAALYDDEKIEIEDRRVYSEMLFDESFFARLWKDAPPSNRCTLTTQYRMPSVIGGLISRLFYNEERLENGAGTENKPSCIPDLLKSNITMVDMSDDENYLEEDNSKNDGARGVTNLREAEVVRIIIKNIRQLSDVRIAVITPYKLQYRQLCAILRNDSEIDMRNIDVNTVDAFQGDEAEIVLYCTTRAKKPTAYFSDYRRVNVALSRAKNNLIIIGSLKYFRSYKMSRIKDSILPSLAEQIEQYGEILTISHFREFNKASNMQKKYDIVVLDLIHSNDLFKADQKLLNDNKTYFYDYDKLEGPIDVCQVGEEYYVADTTAYCRYLVARELEFDKVEVFIKQSV